MPTEMTGDHTPPVTPNPVHLAALRRAFTSTTPEPQVGQVWRARWKRVAQLVVLLEVRDHSVVAAPVSPDPELGDDAAVVIGEDESPFDYAVVVWVGLTKELPIRVLDVYLHDLDEATIARFEKPQGVGAPIDHPLDERAQVRDAIADRMEALARSDWVPAVTEAIDLTAAMRERGLTPGKLAPILGVDAGDIMAIARGDRAPTSEVAGRLGPVLGLSAADLLGSRQLDPDLVWAFDRPSLRRPLWERALAEGFEDEGEFRCHVATSALAVAARQTKTTNPRDRYLGLILEYLNAR